MDTLLWAIAITLIAFGIVGTVLPALPGVVFVFGGIVLAAWIDGFSRVSGWTIAAVSALAVVGLAIDYVAAAAAARRVGASGFGIAGAAIGTLAGVFAGLVGLIFLPLVGAFVGELIATRDAVRAGRVGFASWLGLVAAAVAKIGVAFIMIGVFVTALIF